MLCTSSLRQKSGTQPSKVATNNNLARRIKILADLSVQHALAFSLEMLPQVSGLGFAFAGEKWYLQNRVAAGEGTKRAWLVDTS
jgi:hypothetical protein